MSIRRRWMLSFLALMVGAAGLGTVDAPSAAAAGRPSVRLVTPDTRVDAQRFEDGYAMIDPRMLVASKGGDFEIRAHRPDYDHDLSVWQVVNGPNGSRDIALPSWVTPGPDGLPGFLRLRLTDRDGNVVADERRNFCPQGEDVRINANGPMEPRYPRSCWGGPFVLGSIWGIDRGWAVSALGWDGLYVEAPVGRYRLDVSITRRYAELFGIAPQDARGSVTVRVRQAPECDPHDPWCGKPIPEGVRPAHDHDGALREPSRAPLRGPLGVAPTVAAPSPDTIPDLVALPAWSIFLGNEEGGRQRINFAATVWNAGPAPLLVEGYRREGEAKMDAYQYFLDGEEVVGRRRVGDLVFHDKPGHHHWHFLLFARYSLLDASKERVVLSRKQSFCLAPTDAIDLTVRGAEWRPGSTGLHTACGFGPEDVWIREVLQSGWGDTYFQGIAGQSFDVTDLPNGTYYIAVDANPTGNVYERRADNNRELRKIVLRGRGADRRVEVAPWHGIEW
jgi:hypothetical protein